MRITSPGFKLLFLHASSFSTHGAELDDWMGRKALLAKNVAKATVGEARDNVRRVEGTDA
jgi:hypothetical protein